jgi:predicted CopG family antitoxin
MNTKLTLTIDDQVITKAKKYAKNSGRSLSDLIENYLKNITSSEKDDFKISPKVKSLRGAFKVPKDFDYKTELSRAISEKYKK